MSHQISGEKIRWLPGDKDAREISSGDGGKHFASDFGEGRGALMEMRELVERDLGSFRVKDEPPGITEYGRTTDIGTDDHVSEKQPARDEGFPA